jgi:ATP synthase protein I
VLVLRPYRCGNASWGRSGNESYFSFVRVTLKKRDWRYIKELSYFGSLGLQVALAIFIGYGIGRYLDVKFDTGPWMTVIFFLLGIAAAARNIGLAIKKLRKF